MEPPTSTWAHEAGAQRGRRGGHVRGRERGHGRGGEGKAEGTGGAEAGARVPERSGGWVGSLRAREGGCGAGCAHLGLDLDHLARRETTRM